VISPCSSLSLYPQFEDFSPSSHKALWSRSWPDIYIIHGESFSVIRRQLRVAPCPGGAANRKQQPQYNNHSRPFSHFLLISMGVSCMKRCDSLFPARFWRPQLFFPAFATLIVLSGSFFGVELFAKGGPFPRTLGQRKKDYHWAKKTKTCAVS
jgi:hypothetical protein